MTSRERFLAALKCQPVDKTPIWVMRQAGRYLPEYRALKQKYTFLEMVKAPDLATEVTLQPLKRFDLDAAILFSDILVIPEALGQPYYFREQGGIGMEFTIDSADSIAKLDPTNIQEKLGYVSGALKQIKGEIGDTKALLGFGGSPWTLATYMVEGGSSKDFEKIKTLAVESPKLFHELMEKLTASIIDYFKMQIDSGADAIQIFDSWGALISGHDYWEMSLQWIQQITQALPADFPIIIYAKGMGHHLPDIMKAGAKVASLDWTVKLSEARDQIDAPLAVQGNMDPVLLNTNPEIVKAAAEKILESMRGQSGHIFNLGHGIMPQAKIENMECLVNTVHGFQ